MKVEEVVYPDGLMTVCIWLDVGRMIQRHALLETFDGDKGAARKHLVDEILFGVRASSMDESMRTEAVALLKAHLEDAITAPGKYPIEEHFDKAFGTYTWGITNLPKPINIRVNVREEGPIPMDHILAAGFLRRGGYQARVNGREVSEAVWAWLEDRVFKENPELREVARNLFIV